MTTLFILLTLIINEVMQSNIDCIMDDLNQFPDSWVELYNPTDYAESLNTYRIGLTRNASDAYALPAQTIQANTYATIYCDKENTGRHTDFRLNSDKAGKLYLFHNGQAVDSVSIPAMPSPNIAYGRIGGSNTNDSTATVTWQWMVTPTPESANDTTLCLGVLAPPTFGQKGRVLTPSTRHNTSLTFTLPAGAPAEAVIRYTTDGTEPNEQSPVYSGGTIVFGNTTIVRARTFCNAYASAYSHAESYIYLDHEITLPVVSLITDSRYLNDRNIGIYVEGKDKDNPNYRQDWRRPFGFEYFEGTDSDAILNQLCEGRIQGAASRGMALKSLALYANKRFGEKHFKHEFFPEDKPGLKKFKSIALRNAGNDFDYLYMRDAVIQRSMGRYCDIEWQAYRPAIIVINGVYKGILNIRERANDDNIFTNYNGVEDIDVVENNWDIKTGDGNNWWSFVNYYQDHGHTWNDFEQWMDCDEYIDIFVMNCYYNNLDFPGNNICCWRPRDPSDGLPTRWRWIAKDTDYSLGIYGMASNYNYFAWVNDNGYDGNFTWANGWDATRLFRRLMEDPTFHQRFINKCIVYTGDFLTYNRIWGEIWKPMYDAIRVEYPKHRKLYNEWWPNYSDELNTGLNWLRNRNQHFAQNLGQYYQLGTPRQLNVFTYAHDSTLSLSMHDIPLTRAEWHGYEYNGRDITLEAHSASVPDSRIVWKITHYDAAQTVVYAYGPTCTLRIEPADTSVNVEVIEAEPEDIRQAEAQHEPAARKELRNGSIYILRGDHRYTLLGQ